MARRYVEDLVGAMLRCVSIRPEDVKVALERQNKYDVAEVNSVVPQIPAQPVSRRSAIRAP